MPEHNQFHWTSPDGVEVTLPPIGRVPGGVLRKARKLNELDFVFTLVESVATDAQLEVLDSLPIEHQNGLFEAWQSEAAPGESSGSST